MIKEFEIEAQVENIPVLTAAVDKILKEAGCGRKVMMQIDIALDEIFSNIAKFAYAPGTGKALVRVETGDGAVQITFIDSGIPFDPLAAADPDIDAEAEKRSVGGLGIYLVKKTMDKVRYKHRDGKNILMIRKRFEGS